MTTPTKPIPDEVVRILAERQGAILTDEEHATMADCSPGRSALARDLKACREALRGLLREGGHIEDDRGPMSAIDAAVDAAIACLPEYAK